VIPTNFGILFWRDPKLKDELMAIFKNQDGKLTKLGILPLEKEKALQTLLEANLIEVLELRFLAACRTTPRTVAHSDRLLGLVEKVPDSYNSWTLDRRLYLKSEDELEYVLSLIEQAYKDVL